jgi:hypothetical protein
LTEPPPQLEAKPIQDCRQLEVFMTLHEAGDDGWALVCFKEPTPANTAVWPDEAHWLQRCVHQLMEAQGELLEKDLATYLSAQVYTSGRWQRVFISELWMGPGEARN